MNGMVRINDHPDMTLAVDQGCNGLYQNELSLAHLSRRLTR